MAKTAYRKTEPNLAAISPARLLTVPSQSRRNQQGLEV